MSNQLQDIKQQVNETLRTVNIKPSTLLFGVGAAIALILSYPSLSKYQAEMDKVREEVKVTAAKEEALQRQADFEKSQALIANDRYKECLPVVGSVYRNGRHYFTSISEGQQIFDRITKKPLAQGTVICDANGNSAVINSEGKAAALAYTGNRNIIQERLKRFKTSQYSQPITIEDNNAN